MIKNLERATVNPIRVINWAIDDLEKQTDRAMERFLKFLEKRK